MNYYQVNEEKHVDGEHTYRNAIAYDNKQPIVPERAHYTLARCEVENWEQGERYLDRLDNVAPEVERLQRAIRKHCDKDTGNH